MDVMLEETREIVKQDSPRIRRLKERLLTAPYEVCLERARHFTKVYKETEGMDPALRNALALKATLENQPVHIYEDEWIVGNKTDKFLSPVIAPERGDSLRGLQLDLDILSQKQKPFRMSPQDKKVFLEEIIPYWEGKSVRDRKAEYWIESGIIEPVRGNPIRTVRQIVDIVEFAKHTDPASLKLIAGIREGQKSDPKRALLAWKIRDEVSKNNPNMAVYCYDVQGHLHLGVGKVVNEGFLGIRDRAEKRLAELDRRDPDFQKKEAFLKSVMISMEAACTYAERTRKLAEEMAEKTEDPGEVERLKNIAESLSHAPARGARNFREAVQSTWFALMIGEIQYGMHDVLGIGRADQYLLPFLRKDVESENTTLVEVLDLLEELNLKLTANISIFPEVGAEANGTLGVSQHCVIIGGVDRDGKDATNELSYLMLDAYERMNGAINQLSIRIHKDSPPQFLKRAVEVFRKASGHAFFNDDVIIPALIKDGMSPEDARDYNIVGCIETSASDNCFPCPGGHEIVLPLILYMTMTNGRYPAPVFGQKRSIKTGEPETFETFEDFMKAFRRQLAHNIDVLAEAVEGKDKAYVDFLPSPYVSALMDDCIEKATDMTRGGAKYNFTSMIGRGLGTCVDSLLAIKDIVYDRKELTLSELVEACLENFKSKEWLRKKLQNSTPKYGLDIEEADKMANRIVEMFTEIVQSYRNIRGGRYRTGMYSYGNHVLDGFYTGATPDGRKSGEPLSNGISPSNSTGEGNGLTAYLKSVAQIGQQNLSGGVSLNVKIHPFYLEGEENLEKVSALLKTYFDLGGMHIQPNVVSDKTLREAQKNPDAYRDLVVKVAGYSAYFTDLGHSIQEDIIQRYSFGAP